MEVGLGTMSLRESLDMFIVLMMGEIISLELLLKLLLISRN